MKRHLSALMLALRSTIYRAAALAILAGAAQAALFLFAARRLQGEAALGLEEVFAASFAPQGCAVFFLLLCALLCFTGCNALGSRPGYTLQRLRVTERQAAAWAALGNAICFFLFWAAQLLTALLLCRLYLSSSEPALRGQTVFLAFYRVPFLHSLLPLRDLGRAARDLALLVGLAITTACFPLRQRHGERRLEPLALAAVTAVAFAQPMGKFSSDLLLSLIALALGGSALFSLWKEVPDEEQA